MLINIPLMIFFKVIVKICVLLSCRALNYAWIKENVIPLQYLLGKLCSKINDSGKNRKNKRRTKNKSL